MKIAVVGGGISGNLAARLISAAHDVTLLEADVRLGGHSRTLDVGAFGQTHSVDTGFMVFNERTYPNFCRLLGLLGIESRETDMSLSVRCEADNFEYQGSSLAGLFAQPRNLVRPAFWRMLRDITRFNREAVEWLRSGGSDITVRELLRAGKYDGWFVTRYLTPMTAAIWSCPAGRLLDFPAHFLLGFLNNHGLLQITGQPRWRTVVGGARAYVKELIRPLGDRVVTGAPVRSVRRFDDHVEIYVPGRATISFDAVVLACHADRAIAILGDADDRERRVLGATPYQENVATLHTDIALLPRRRRAWASWNYHVPADESAPVAVTYDLSRLQGLETPSPILLTLNGEERVDPRTILDRHVFRHPRFTAESPRAQLEHADLNGRRRTYFCGAYWGYGFHEDGVNSALAVARSLGLGWDQWRASSTRESYATSV